MSDPDRADSLPFPVDFDALRKGDVLAAETIEEIFHVSRHSDAYQFRVMELRSRIEAELAGRGYPVTLKAEGKSLRILTDEEAVAYNIDRYRVSQHGLARAQRRLMAVDTTQLSPESARAQDRAVQIHSMEILAMQKTRRQFLALNPIPKELAAKDAPDASA